MGWADPAEGTLPQQVVRAAQALEQAVRRWENAPTMAAGEAMVEARKRLTALLGRVSL